MAKKLQKSLQDYFSKIKSPRPQIQSPFNSLLSSSSRNRILSGCKQPRTPSFALERNEANHDHGRNNNVNNGVAARLSDVDRFLLENFKSLFLGDDEVTVNNNTIKVSEDHIQNHECPKLGSILFDQSPPPLDLCGSNRFFVTLDSSGSLVTCDEAGSGSGSSSSSTITLNGSSNSHEAMDHQTLPHNSIAVLSHSASPYEDFRRSMQDVVEARFRRHERVDWDFMEEVLLCFLNLNDKKSYKFILSAFVDLINVLRHQSSERAPAKPRSVRTFRKNKTKEVTLEFVENKNMSAGDEVQQKPWI